MSGTAKSLERAEGEGGEGRARVLRVKGSFQKEAANYVKLCRKAEKREVSAKMALAMRVITQGKSAHGNENRRGFSGQ